MAEGHDANPLSHVLDHGSLEVPWIGQEWKLPAFDIPGLGTFQVSRFMVMEVIATVLLVAILIPLSRHIANTRVSRGRFWQMFEAVVVFIRDGIARPAIDGGDHGHDDHGHDPHVKTAHDNGIEGHGPEKAHGKPDGHHGRTSDFFLPYLWTVFFFVLGCNLLGMIPGGASATGNINVTAVLALMTLGAVIVAGVRTSGFIGFWLSLVPKMDVPGWLKPFLWCLMFVVEVAGLLIRHFVLAVRLFANMLAGHLVPGRDPRFYRDGERPGDLLGHAREHRNGLRPELPGDPRRVPPGLHLHLPLGPLHRDGGAPALTPTGLGSTDEPPFPNAGARRPPASPAGRDPAFPRESPARGLPHRTVFMESRVR